MNSFLELAHPLGELVSKGPGHNLHCFERIVENLISVLLQSLKPEVHLGLRRVWNAVAYELHVTMSR